MYQYRDHLENIRVSYTDGNGDGTITQDELIEENTYYPFGLRLRGVNDGIGALGNSVAQRWKFGGKELQDELRLDWYDITARNYDPALGRWNVIDPKADDILQVDITPYNYSWNNPTNINDPDGECPWCWGAVIGLALEYGSQVASNLVAGQDSGLAQGEHMVIENESIQNTDADLETIICDLMVKQMQKHPEKAANSKNKKENINKAINEAKDATVKETVKSGLEKALEDYKFKTKQ